MPQASNNAPHSASGAGPVRIAVGVLTLSAGALVAMLSDEGYTDRAVIPTKGDVPTVGFGSTVHEDGSRVQMGDTVTPQRALVKALAHVSKDEAAFRASLPGAKLTQGEFDVYLDFTYQYGVANWRNSSMRRHVMAERYIAACDALLAYRKAAGYDCSTMIDGKPNKRCWGVWKRQQERHAKCVVAATGG